MRGRIIAMATTCEQVEQLLPGYEEGDLALDERRRLERHVGGCARCRSLLQGLRQSWERLGEWPDVEPSPSYRARFWQTVGREEERRRWSWLGHLADRRWAPVSAAAVLAVGFFTGSVFSGPSPTPAPTVAIAPPGASSTVVPEPPKVGEISGMLSGRMLDEALAAVVPPRR